MREEIKETVPTIAEKIASIENSLVDARAKLKAETSRKRAYLMIGGMGAIPIILHYTQLLPLPIWLVFIAWIILILFPLTSLGVDLEKPRADIEKLELTKRLYYDFSDIKPGEAYFDRLVQINIENLGEYYTLVKIHTRQSFRLSSVVAIVGFLLIMTGLAMGFVKEELRNIAYLSAASGMVVEFIGGIFFYLYSKTVRQLKTYHDSLLDVQNILLSFKLIEGTEDDKERSTMTQSMIGFLSARPKASKDS